MIITNIKYIVDQHTWEAKILVLPALAVAGMLSPQIF